MKLARRPEGSRRYEQVARAEAAEATARRITDAFLARLMREWFDEITLDRVAADAGVAVQTVVRRFGGKQGLLESAVHVLAAQINARRGTPTGDVAAIVAHVVLDYEQIGDAVIRLLALEARHPIIAKVLEFGRSEHRAWVTAAFAEPLAQLAGSPRRRALDALVIATGVYTWKLLRREMGRSVAAAQDIMRVLVAGTLAEHGLQNHRGDRP